MKLFLFETYKDTELFSSFDSMAFEMSALIIKICESINKRQKNLIHTALFLFHCQTKIASFHRFDRFIYVCAAILIATKLTQNVDYYPQKIIRTLRRILRQKKGVEEKQDEQQKIKKLLKKLFEAELIIMINIGFEFDIELGLYWLKEWQKYINNPDLFRKFQENLTQLYRTNVVIYFKPELLALAAISMTIKNQDLSFQLTTWNEIITTKLQEQENNIKTIIDYFNAKRRFLLMSY